MPLNALAPAFFFHNQLPSDPPITLRRPTTMNLPRAQIYCGMPSPFVPPSTLHIPQPINDGTDLPFTLQKDPSIVDPDSVQPLPGPSTLFPSSLHPQAQCLHAIQKRIKQLQHQLKAAHLDRKALQLIALQFHNDFAMLRYLLLYSVGNFSPHDNSDSHSTIQPGNEPNPNPKPKNVQCNFWSCNEEHG